jgi:hypothetical protein
VTKIPDENYAKPWADDSRVAPPRTAGERETLTAW